MSLQSVATQFVDLCNQGRNFDIMRTMYSPDIVSVEADGHQTVGQLPVIKKSENWVADKSFDFQSLRGPFFSAPSQFAIHFTHKVTPKSTGQQITLEEIALYTINQNDQITREQFFFTGSR